MALAALALLCRVADTAIHGTARCRPERHHHRLLAAPADGRMLPVARASTLIAGLFAAGATAPGGLLHGLHGVDLLPPGGEDKGLAAIAAHHHLICHETRLMHYVFPCHRPSGRNPTSTPSAPCEAELTRRHPASVIDFPTSSESSDHLNMVVLTWLTNLFSRACQLGPSSVPPVLWPLFAHALPGAARDPPLENPPELEGGSTGVSPRTPPYEVATDPLGRAPSLASVYCL